MKMFLVKYALTTGIREIEIKDAGVDYAGVDYVYEKGNPYNMYKIGRDIFETKEDALHFAKLLRVKRIGSLTKQLAKLEAMTF